MEILWFLGAIGALIGAVLVYVGLRDRRRLSSADDSAASRKALADTHRRASGGHFQ